MIKISNWFDKNLTIFKNTFIKTLITPTFLVTTTIYLISLTTTTSVFFSPKLMLFRASMGLGLWITVSITSFYFLILAIVFAVRLYSDQVKNGIVKMELRANKSVAKIFFERLFALLIIFISMIVLSLLIEIIVFSTTRFNLAKWFYKVYLFKYLYLSVYSLILLSFMIFWLTFAHQVIPVMITTIIFLIMTFNPFVGNLLLNRHIIDGAIDNSSEFLKISNKTYFYKKYNELIKSENNYATKIAKTFYQLDTALDKNPDNEWNILDARSLILDGFLMEAETVLDNNEQEINFQSFKYSDLFNKEENGLYKFLELIGNITLDPNFNSKDIKNWANSRFSSRSSRLSEKFDYINAFKKIQKKSEDKDLQEISKLIYEFIETNMYFYSDNILKDFYQKFTSEKINTEKNFDYFTKSKKTPGYFDFSTTISILAYNYLVYSPSVLVGENDFYKYKSGVIKNIWFNPGQQAFYLYSTPPTRSYNLAQMVSSNFYDQGMSRLMFPDTKKSNNNLEDEIPFPKESQWKNLKIKNIEVINFWGILFWWIGLSTTFLTGGYFIFRKKNWIN
ncbi:hypothetical protein [Spiroplasma alleghenense]|uniref:Uncharacterized protein n=1 Tax=Spiroplasma alleghenense TaxID=216931 RepID=A0A345Z584_9MOLU|nr:hypothetical protein [Spiroplasma alleghenense]AXK51763.1 hypothetical protein SALLE_v1c10930 [Spiroplasma alleghenense]